MRRIGKVLAMFLFISMIVSAFSMMNTALACDGGDECPSCGCFNCCSFCKSGEVFYLGKDTVTKGDWQNAVGSPIGVYGSYAHILPNAPMNKSQIPVGNFSVPVGNYTWTDYGWTPLQIVGLPWNRTDPPYWDEHVSVEPKVNYTLTGTLYNMPGIGPIQYPVFEWAWDNFDSTDPRAAHFKTYIEGVGGPGTRLTCWDDGSERGFPSDGYFNVTLDFPNDAYTHSCCCHRPTIFMLSLYAYDKERVQRANQTIYITNESGEVLASAVMNGTEFDEGIYLQFLLCDPTTIVVQVKKGPESLNAVLSGIFVDKVKCRCKCRCTKSKCFWQINLAKLLGYLPGEPQVNETDMERYIAFARDRCPDVFGDVDSLEDAYKVFKSYSSSMLAKAKAQFYALLLNVASDRAYETDIVAPYLHYKLRYKYPTLGLSDYPFTLQQVVDTSCNNIVMLENLEFTKDMCDKLNNGYIAAVLDPIVYASETNAYLVVRGLNNKIYYRTHTSSSNSWESWNVVPTGLTCDSPAAALYSGKLYLVVRGMDGYSLWFGWITLADGSFSGWTRLSGATESAPALVSYDSRLTLVARGLDDYVYYRIYDCTTESWSSWKAIPNGTTCDSPAAAALNGYLHIVVRRSDGSSLWHGYLDISTDDFYGWQRVSGATLSRPTLTASETVNRLYLVVRGLDDRIYYNAWNGAGWDGWKVLPNGVTCDGLAATLVDTELHVVVRGLTGNDLWHSWINLSPSNFSGWTRITGETPSASTLTN